MITNHLAFAQLPPVARRRGAFAFGLALCTLGLSFSASAQSIFTTFDVPGSVQTIPISINSKGAVIGLYTDQNFVGHGFLRSPGGIFTTIDPPGSVFTVAQSINSAGGDYGTLPRELCDLRIPSSFRMALSTQSTFRAPPFRPSLTVSTRRGTIAGSYVDPTFPAKNLFHGFLRNPDGTFTTFDAPGGVFETSVTSINDLGVSAGYYEDPKLVNHGFLRASDGTLTTFDPPVGSLAAGPQSINSAGAITGAYIDATFTFHAYLRGPDGTFNTFDAPGAGKGVLQGTTPQSINSAGAITGASINAANGFHGFLRTPDGTITEFNAPGAAKGTSALSINSVGTITGFYIDANGVIHGFLRSVPGRH